MNWKLGVVSLIKWTTYKYYKYFHGGENTKKFIRHRSDQKNNTTWLQDIIRAFLQIIQVPKPCSWTYEYSNKKYGNLSSSQKSFANA